MMSLAKLQHDGIEGLHTRQRAEEFGVGGTMMSLPTATKWQLQNGSKSAIMIHYPRTAACLFTRLRAEESKLAAP